MVKSVRHGGAWKAPKARMARHGGVWKPWQKAFVYRGGQWVQFFTNLSASISTNFSETGSGNRTQIANFTAIVSGGSGSYTYAWGWSTTGGTGWGDPIQQQGAGGPSTFRCTQVYNTNEPGQTYYTGHSWCIITDTVTGASITVYSDPISFNTNGFS